MEIHRFEKLWFGVSMLLIVGWIATVIYGAVGPGVAMVGDGGTTVDAEDPTASDEFREPGVYCNDARTQCDVYVIAQQFVFRPDPIVVPAGSTVTFHVTSADTVHGYEMPGTNVNLMVIPGQVTEATVAFDDPKRYGVVCNEYCGSGHHTMEGVLRVVPQSEYDASGGEGA
jgi:cytochrome c oxidase subunit 2